MKKIRAAVVGYGNIGKFTLEALEAAPDFEVAGIVRRNGAENKPAELADYPVVKDIKELQDVDVAILATPTRSVEQYAKEILALGSNTVDSFDIHTKFAVGKELAGKRMVRANALLLSVAAQFNDPTAVEIMKWLNDTTIISGSNDEKIWNTATIQLDDIRMKQRIVEFSRYADLGIENIEKIDNTIVSMHTQYDDEGNEVKAVTFPFRKNESEGTIKYFSLAYPIIDALDNGKRLIIDEFDSKMHPLLTCRIITLFNSKETNPKNAQLIFTTHDTNLLSANIFRRDQIWFTQKDRYGATELYSLAEYNVRNDASFEKDYLSGKYGAIPIVGDLTRLFNTQEK